MREGALRVAGAVVMHRRVRAAAIAVVGVCASASRARCEARPAVERDRPDDDSFRFHRV